MLLYVVVSRVKPYLTLSVYKYSRTSWKALWLTLLSSTIWSLPSGVVLMELPSVLMTSCSLMTTVVIVVDDDMLGGWLVCWLFDLVCCCSCCWESKNNGGFFDDCLSQARRWRKLYAKVMSSPPAVRRSFMILPPGTRYENFYFEFSPRQSWPWRLQYRGWKCVHVSGFHVL